MNNQTNKDLPGINSQSFNLEINKEWLAGVKEEQLLNYIEELRKFGKSNFILFDDGEITDGYHSFNELYEFRKMYNAVLFNEWASCVNSPQSIDSPPNEPKYNVHKSWKHNDGEWCFGEAKKWFIVSAMLPTGLISNHYKAEDWDLFKVPEVEKALFEFDGHTGKDVLQRLKDLCND